ncbi:pyroglutamyl-peptidase I [Arthrobacter sp. JZ12]|uniref:pyroglutamyl-peptidase I n=1 Tax=Arthrobacter sp. JZ12 TaxID=2654190 RepID=UPI002B46ED2B|nr:pyroglutamyl-peptidase I [Arthrobacter sp. JZ12]WRH24654.1 pyroglutamyl-peptidase I [Arthrobacter sp. JZ12]
MILLTGFEPFGGESTNPSWGAAQRAAALLNDAGEPAAAVQLPCVFGTSIGVLAGALEAHQPDLVVCVGQAGGRAELSLERVAINFDDARIPDNAGNQPVDVPVRQDGPAAYFSSLALKRSLVQLTEAGLPAAVSQTAGTYVCNHVFYGLMDLLQDRSATRGGFVHVPFSSEQAMAHRAPGMLIEEMAAGLVIIARASLQHQTDLPVPAGAEH